MKLKKNTSIASAYRVVVDGCRITLNMFIRHQHHHRKSTTLYSHNFARVGNFFAKNSWNAITLSHTHIQPSIDFCLTLISPIYPHHIEIDTSHNVRGELLSRYQKRKNLTFWWHTHIPVYIGKCWDIKQASIKWVVAIEMTSHAAFSTIKKTSLLYRWDKEKKRGHGPSNDVSFYWVYVMGGMHLTETSVCVCAKSWINFDLVPFFCWNIMNVSSSLDIISINNPLPLCCGCCKTCLHLNRCEIQFSWKALDYRGKAF